MMYLIGSDELFSEPKTTFSSCMRPRTIDHVDVDESYLWFATCVFQDYEPSGTTPIRCETDVPSKETIESLRTLPMETLLEGFRENNAYESFDIKELKPSLIPRSPLTQVNQRR